MALETPAQQYFETKVLTKATRARVESRDSSLHKLAVIPCSGRSVNTGKKIPKPYLCMRRYPTDQNFVCNKILSHLGCSGNPLGKKQVFIFGILPPVPVNLWFLFVLLKSQAWWWKWKHVLQAHAAGSAWLVRCASCSPALRGRCSYIQEHTPGQKLLKAKHWRDFPERKIVLSLLEERWENMTRLAVL